jgi:hypothetical protein
MCHSDDKHAGTDKAYTQQRAVTRRSGEIRNPVGSKQAGVASAGGESPTSATGTDSTRDRIGCSSNSGLTYFRVCVEKNSGTVRQFCAHGEARPAQHGTSPVPRGNLVTAGGAVTIKLTTTGWVCSLASASVDALTPGHLPLVNWTPAGVPANLTRWRNSGRRASVSAVKCPATKWSVALRSR